MGSARTPDRLKGLHHLCVNTLIYLAMHLNNGWQESLSGSTWTPHFHMCEYFFHNWMRVNYWKVSWADFDWKCPTFFDSVRYWVLGWVPCLCTQWCAFWPSCKWQPVNMTLSQVSLLQIIDFWAGHFDKCRKRHLVEWLVISKSIILLLTTMWHTGVIFTHSMHCQLSVNSDFQILSRPIHVLLPSVFYCLVCKGER